jgi:two-component system sensor histidine kinase VicK
MDYVKIEIHDTGMGIKKEELSRIFQSFVQLGEPEIRKGGIGLGLAICKEIIEKHKGRIWAESDLREGTSFYFILPI